MDKMKGILAEVGTSNGQKEDLIGKGRNFSH